MAIQVILRHTNCIEGSTQKFKIETNNFIAMMLSDKYYEQASLINRFKF